MSDSVPNMTMSEPCISREEFLEKAAQFVDKCYDKENPSFGEDDLIYVFDTMRQTHNRVSHAYPFEDEPRRIDLVKRYADTIIDAAECRYLDRDAVFAALDVTNWAAFQAFSKDRLQDLERQLNASEPEFLKNSEARLAKWRRLFDACKSKTPSLH